MCLNTGRSLHRRRWTSLPIPAHVVARVDVLGARDGQSKLLIFTDASGRTIEGDAADDENIILPGSENTDADAAHLTGMNPPLKQKTSEADGKTSEADGAIIPVYDDHCEYDMDHQAIEIAEEDSENNDNQPIAIPIMGGVYNEDPSEPGINAPYQPRRSTRHIVEHRSLDLNQPYQDRDIIIK